MRREGEMRGGLGRKEAREDETGKDENSSISPSVIKALL